VYAVKIINKTELNKLHPQQRSKQIINLNNEIRILKQIRGHKIMINLQGTYEDQTFLYLVFDKCAGGDLFDCIMTHGRFGEKQVKIIMKQILEGVRDLHVKYRVCHCDLKPENVLLVNDISKPTQQVSINTGSYEKKEEEIEEIKQDEDEQRLEIKIIDFGLSKYVKPFEEIYDSAGTLYYVAPEIIREGKHNQSADCWNLGIIMFMLIYGRLPFFVPLSCCASPFHQMSIISKMILDGFHSIELSVQEYGWGPFFDSHIIVSVEAKDLISKLLRSDHHVRYSADLALRHKWFNND